MNDSISLADVKIALKDERFRNNLPSVFSDDLSKYLKNPGCGCNLSFYKKLLVEAKDQLKEYFPGKELNNNYESTILSKNNFSVINCSIYELESILRKLPPGRKQLALSRYEDKVTVVLNDLEFLH